MCISTQALCKIFTVVNVSLRHALSFLCSQARGAYLTCPGSVLLTALTHRNPIQNSRLIAKASYSEACLPIRKDRPVATLRELSVLLLFARLHCRRWNTAPKDRPRLGSNQSTFMHTALLLCLIFMNISSPVRVLFITVTIITGDIERSRGLGGLRRDRNLNKGGC